MWQQKQIIRRFRDGYIIEDFYLIYSQAFMTKSMKVSSMKLLLQYGMKFQNLSEANSLFFHITVQTMKFVIKRKNKRRKNIKNKLKLK